MNADVPALLAAGHQCDVSQEGYYWARLIVREPPRHLPQPGPYPKLCNPSVVRLLRPPVGPPLVLSVDARGRVDMVHWIFLELIEPPQEPERHDT